MLNAGETCTTCGEHHTPEDKARIANAGGKMPQVKDRDSAHSVLRMRKHANDPATLVDHVRRWAVGVGDDDVMAKCQELRPR